MVNETSDRPRLTPKGARTRARIVEEAAALIHERGVAGDHLGRRQGGSGSQRLADVPLLPRQERTRAGGHRLPSRHHRQSPAARARQRERSRSLAEHGDHRSEAHPSKGGLPTWFARWSTRRERPRGPSAHRGRVRSVGSRHQRWTADPFMPTGSSRPTSTRTTSPLLCSPRSKEGFYSPRCNGVPVRSKLRSIPSSPLPSADEPKPGSSICPPGVRVPERGAAPPTTPVQRTCAGADYTARVLVAYQPTASVPEASASSTVMKTSCRAQYWPAGW